MIHKLRFGHSFRRGQQVTAHQEKEDAAEEFVSISKSGLRGLPSCTRERMNISTICLPMQAVVNSPSVINSSVLGMTPAICRNAS